MNAKLVLSSMLLAAGFAGNALADEYVAVEPFVGSKTRAEVRAELDAFKRSGVNPWSQTYNQVANFTSTTTQAAVVADFLESRDEVRAFTGEDSGSSHLAQARLSGGSASVAAAYEAP